MLEKEFKYFIEHQSELVKQYDGEFLVIKDENVLGHYSTLEEAYEVTSKDHEIGTFLIQHCISGEGAYKQTFNSRAVFA